MSARFALRDATAGVHGRLDALYGSLDLGRPDDYATFLRSHAAAYLPIEDALAAAGAGGLVPGWLQRRRAEALRADLAELGLEPPPAAASPPFGSEAAVLGGLYVLEGSRLGGAVLIRSVPSSAPKKFLSVGNPTDWRSFTGLMDDRLGSRGDLEAAMTSARAVFGVFERCALAALGAVRS